MSRSHESTSCADTQAASLTATIAAARKADELKHGRPNERRVIAAVVAAATSEQLDEIEAHPEKYGREWQRAVANRKAGEDRKPRDLSAAAAPPAAESAAPPNEVTAQAAPTIEAPPAPAAPGRRVAPAADIERRSNEAYGALKANLHVAGYTFERACQQLKFLIAEDRWKRCGAGFDHPKEFIASISLEQLRPTVEQRRDLAKFIKAELPAVSNRDIGKAVGASHTQINRDLGAGTNVPPEEKSASKNNGGTEATGTNVPPALSGVRSARLVARREERIARDQVAAEKVVAASGPGTIKLRYGDFRTALRDLRDVDAIITDPPYGEKYLHLLADLAEFADRVLKPDGILAVLFGQAYLLGAAAQLKMGRPYRWMGCFLTEGPGYVSHQRKIQSNWKPLLIFGGGPRLADVFRTDEYGAGTGIFCSEGGDGAAKQLHPWGQNFEAFKSIIETLTAPDATVVDPFAGGGTTLFAAKIIGRNAIGSEIDKAVFDKLNAAIDHGNAEGRR
jgi:hypothetical protein